jgi:glyoxylase-like metal-dependent hydrolase (beta-lactamase superfamily II)
MSQPPLVNATEYPGGVICVDTGYVRDRLAGAYLLEADDRVAIVETGTSATVPRLMKVLEERGWIPEQVQYVIVTHVHLDHAGGAGLLMQKLPEATFVVHPRGARHMTDPSRLEASVRAVYSDDYFEETFAPLLPIDAERTLQMNDGDRLKLGHRELQFIDSPGHARHHFCVWDKQTRGWFTGDTFGISYREFDTEKGPFIFPTTTPIELDPPRLRESVQRLLAREPEWMYLTHYGRVGEPARLAGQLLDILEAMVEMAERHEHAERRSELIRTELLGHLVATARAHGVAMPDERLHALLETDVDLNTQGLEVWLERRARA